MYGRRLSKADPRVDAYGCVDELNAALGLARSVAADNFLSDQILAAQRDLIIVMGELATAPSDHERYAKDGFRITTTEMVDRITSLVFDLEKDKSLYPKDWVLPGRHAGFCGIGFCSHNMPPRGATHRRVPRRRRR